MRDAAVWVWMLTTEAMISGELYFSVEPIEPPMDRWKGADTSISGLRNCMNGGLIDSNEEGGGSGYY